MPMFFPLEPAASLEICASPRLYGCAMKGVDCVFQVTPPSPTETEEGLAAVAAAKRAGVRHLVYLSVYHVERAPTFLTSRRRWKFIRLSEIQGWHSP